MAITKSEFREWKDHPVTQAFYAYIVERRADFTNALVHNDRAENFDDEFLRGSIQVLEGITTIELEDIDNGA